VSQPTQAAVPAVTVTTAATTGPDGKPWVQILIQCGPAILGLIVPDQTCDELAAIFAKNLPEAAAAVRRAGLGLILPGNGGIPS
jgi:hypothetical protein